MKNEFNPAIKAVVSIRKIALDILDSNRAIKESYHENINNFDKAITLISPDHIILDEWILIKTDLNNSAQKLIDILGNLTQRFKDKNVKNISEIWDNYNVYSTSL